MISVITSKEEFKKNNINSWKLNSEYWLKKDYIHHGVSEALIQKITDELKFEKINILDVGCGSGWLARDLPINKIKSSYIGIDNCTTFVNYLNRLYSRNKAINFKFLDFEEEISEEDKQELESELIICCLSLIEMPYFDYAFYNISKLLKENGTVIIVNLNPIYEIIRSCQDFDEINSSLELYRKSDDPIYISKKISVNGDSSFAEYYRILYSVDDYCKIGKKYGLNNVYTFKEINKNNDIDTPLYDYLCLKRE